MESNIIREIFKFSNEENEAYCLEILMNIHPDAGNKRSFFIKTSNLLKSVGVKDTISSLLNVESSTGSEVRYGKLYESIKKRGMYKGAFYFRNDEFLFFCERYLPKGVEKQSDWQMFVDWSSTMLLDLMMKYAEIDEKRLKETEEKGDLNKSEVRENTMPKDSLKTLTVCAKMIGIRPKVELIPFLLKRKILYRVGDKTKGALVPMQKMIEKGFMVVTEVNPQHMHGELIVPQTKVTSSGYKYIKKLYNESNDK